MSISIGLGCVDRSDFDGAVGPPRRYVLGNLEGSLEVLELAADGGDAQVLDGKADPGMSRVHDPGSGGYQRYVSGHSQTPHSDRQSAVVVGRPGGDAAGRSGVPSRQRSGRLRGFGEHDPEASRILVGVVAGHKEVLRAGRGECDEQTSFVATYGQAM